MAEPATTCTGSDPVSVDPGEPPFKVYLRDCNEAMVSAWEDEQAFGVDTFKDRVQVSTG